MKSLLLILAAAIALPAMGQEGFILKAGDGEHLMNGIVVKLSPENGTTGVSLAEQTFPKGGTTGLHVHDQVSESFYVVSGTGEAQLGDQVEQIGPGDVIYVPAGDVHQLTDIGSDEPLVVVFFMPSPDIVRFMRAVHERLTSDPNRPITAEEMGVIREKYPATRRLGE